MTLSLRRARPADARALARVHVASWRSAYAGLLADEVLDGLDEVELERAWRAEIEHPDAADVRVWVAELQARLVAYARTGPARDTDAIEQGAAEIYGFYVDPAEWGAGVGRRLMGHIEADLAGRGHPHVTLNVVEGNAGARAFYERLGFTPDGPAAPWQGAPQVRYRKPLGGRP